MQNDRYRKCLHCVEQNSAPFIIILNTSFNTALIKIPFNREIKISKIINNYVISLKFTHFLPNNKRRNFQLWYSKINVIKLMRNTSKLNLCIYKILYFIATKKKFRFFFCKMFNLFLTIHPLQCRLWESFNNLKVFTFFLDFLILLLLFCCFLLLYLRGFYLLVVNHISIFFSVAQPYCYNQTYLSIYTNFFKPDTHFEKPSSHRQ